MHKLIAVTISYLLGSIPTGLILTRALRGIDIREHGSKNIGATNVFRVVGKKWGIVVLLIDAFKGGLAVTLPFHFFIELTPSFGVFLGLATLFGNTFPVWLRFKGGKGIATSLGVFVGLVPGPALFTFGLWCIIFAVTRILSVASLAAAYLFPVAVYFFLKDSETFRVFFALSLFLSVFITYTHRANIQRILKGEEKRLI